MAARKSGKKSKKPMDDQTEFVFRSIRSNDVDPVSGNEVPLALFQKKYVMILMPV